MDNAVGHARLFLIVCYHHDCAAVFLVELMQEFHHFRTHSGVKIAGRLVGEDNFRISHDCAGYRHTLALPSGELGGEMAFSVRDAEAFEHIVDLLLPCLGSCVLAIEQGESHIVGDVQRGNQMKALEHESYVGVAEMGKSGVTERFGIGADYLHLPLGCLVKKSDDVEEG